MTVDNRIRELIALGASVAANCQLCLEYHGRKAAEYGIDPAELAQAIEIGRTVRRGAATNVDQVVSNASFCGDDRSHCRITDTPDSSSPK